MFYASIIPNLDITTLTGRYQVGRLTPTDVIRGLVRRVEEYPDAAVWIHRLPQDALLAQSLAVEKRRAAGASLPLFGVPFAVKDSMDVAGYPTTCACPAFAYVPQHTAPVVSRLLDAGAIFVGKTNLDQFGSGLAGDRSPYGACRNVFHPDFISGGSSSGSAVAVAAGLVSFALGTDTAGSGRVPAGCNNIVGLKPTPGRLSTQGLVPSCYSLDCVSILALTVEDAQLVCTIAGDLTDIERRTSNVERRTSNVEHCTFGSPRDEDLEFFGDRDQAALFQAALTRLEQMGARRLTVDYRPFREVASLLYEGPWVAERLAGIEEFLKEHADEVHPVTRTIIESGGRYSGVDVFKAQHKLRTLRGVCLEVFDRAEVLVVPTMPTIPTLAEVKGDSLGWSRRLGYYTNFANLLQLAALAVPSGFTPRGLPAGITLLGPGGSERRLCELGRAWQRNLDLPLGATGKHLSWAGLPSPTSLPESGWETNPTPEQAADGPPLPAPRGFVRVAVAGAHLQGQALHQDLRRTGARLVRACRTASRYRFLALMHLNPPRPGLLRDDQRAGAVEVEIYDLPLEGFGTLVASVAPPLAIGTIELADGEAVKGFLCESWAAARARDITEFGGWCAFRNHNGQGNA